MSSGPASQATFRYILRYLIDPAFQARERIEELVCFCRQARIEEVMMFVAAEELSDGHPTDDELDAYIALGREMRSRLADQGIDMSLNPWSTIYHNGRGRALRAGQNFRLMVGENGVLSTVTACPLCENWQRYLTGTFGRMAREIGPTTLWIEDDWRLRNHDVALAWGGCFCDAHLARFSARVGTEVSRERLLDEILAPGRPHAWRDVWLDLSRDSLLEPLQKLGETIRREAPTTRLALMSSNPDAHAAEGRDWGRFQDAISDGRAFISRPNMGPYTQGHALSSPPSTTRLTIANLKGPIEVYPELENSPRCGPFSKSRAYSVFQIFHAAVMGSQGITINHYDMLGNGISLDPHFGIALAEAKTQLDSLKALGLDDRLAQGVRVLFRPTISRHVHVDRKEGMKSLSQNSRAWSDACAILGISHHFSAEIDPGQGPALVNEQTVRALDDEEVQRLLSGGVILDVRSVEILLSRGFGDEIGIEAAERVTLNESGYAYEQIEIEGAGTEANPFPRMTAQRCSPWLLKMTPAPQAACFSSIRTASHRTLWPGSLFFENRRGGKILSLTYPVNGGGQFFMGFFNVFRQNFMQEVLFRCFSAPGLACAADPALHLCRIPTRRGTLLAFFNPTDDALEKIELLVPRSFPLGGYWECLDERGAWKPIESVATGTAHSTRHRFEYSLKPLRAAFIHHVSS